MHSRHKQRGFGLTEILAIIIVLMLLGLAGWYIYNKHHQNDVLTGSSSVQYSVNKNEILYNNKPYIPYGATIYGLSDTGYESNLGSDIAQINALANYWHGNTVRIQVSPTLFNGNSSSFMAAFNQEIETAKSDGLNTIISAQYERDGKIAGPDSSTVAFWKSVAPLYANDPKVWFDLFNEPTEGCSNGENLLPGAACWAGWRNGTSQYVGMQTLVNDVRAVAPNNLILAEGLSGAKSLDGINEYELSGGNIIYSVHPYFAPIDNSSSKWATNFGDLASQIPIIVGEWGEYESIKGSCVTNAPTLVPEFLSYLKSNNIGLIAWTLQPGIMVEGSNLEDPTAFSSSSPYQCAKVNPDNAQGSGADIRALFMGD
jgi:hypothetical protein